MKEEEVEEERKDSRNKQEGGQDVRKKVELNRLIIKCKGNNK
jgi:hypothetical protein